MICLFVSLNQSNFCWLLNNITICGVCVVFFCLFLLHWDQPSGDQTWIIYKQVPAPGKKKSFITINLEILVAFFYVFVFLTEVILQTQLKDWKYVGNVWYFLLFSYTFEFDLICVFLCRVKKLEKKFWIFWMYLHIR